LSDESVWLYNDNTQQRKRLSTGLYITDCLLSSSLLYVDWISATQLVEIKPQGLHYNQL